MQMQRNRALECPGWRGWGEGGGLTGWRSGRAGESGMAVLLCMGEGLFCDDRLWLRIGRV